MKAYNSQATYTTESQKWARECYIATILLSYSSSIIIHYSRRGSSTLTGFFWKRYIPLVCYVIQVSWLISTGPRRWQRSIAVLELSTSPTRANLLVMDSCGSTETGFPTFYTWKTPPRNNPSTMTATQETSSSYKIKMNNNLQSESIRSIFTQLWGSQHPYGRNNKGKLRGLHQPWSCGRYWGPYRDSHCGESIDGGNTLTW